MKWLDGWLDKTTENSVRGISQKTSRRGFLGKVAGVVIGGAARSFRDDVRDMVEPAMRRIAGGICAAMKSAICASMSPP